MGNLGGPEILVILLVALVFLGPTKLPEVARQVGRAMAEVRKVTSGFQREMNDALSDDSDARARGAAVAATRPAPPSQALVTEAPATDTESNETVDEAPRQTPSDADADDSSDSASIEDGR